MFGPSEEVRRAQAAEATGLKDIPASNGVYIILIKRQEVQGLSVDMERLTEDTYGDEDHAVELVTGTQESTLL